MNKLSSTYIWRIQTIMANMILVFVCLLLLGCQQTPESELVAGKDLDKMIQMAQAPHEGAVDISNILDVPNEYSAEMTGQKELVRVTVDAEIVIPEVETIPIIRVIGQAFSQEITDKLVNALFADKQLYTFDSLKVQTKEDIIVQLAEFKQRKIELEESGIKPTSSNNNQGAGENEDAGGEEQIIDEMSVETGNELDNVNNMIKILENQLKQAPVEKNLIESTSKLKSFDLLDSEENVDRQQEGLLQESVYLGFVNEEGNCERLKVLNHERYNIYSAQYVNRNDYFDTGLYFTEPQWELWQQSEEAENPQLVMPTLTVVEAQKITHDLLMELDIDYLECTKIENVIGITGVYDSTGTELGERIKGYRLQYVRKLNSIPITYTSTENSYNEQSQSWDYERMTFIVDDRGIIEMNWHAPYLLMETLVDNANVLPYDEIQKIFEKWILIKQEEEIDDYKDIVKTSIQKRQIDITEIKLGFTRITEQDNISNGILIPVWDFFGTATYFDVVEGEEVVITDFDSSRSYLTINAIDGSIINRELGY